MKFINPIKEPKSDVQKEFNSWFSERKQEGLKYIYIDVIPPKGLLVSILKYTPKAIRNKYNNYYLDKVLKEFLSVV